MHASIYGQTNSTTLKVNGTEVEAPYEVMTEFCLKGQHFGQSCCASENSQEDGGAFAFPDFSALTPTPKEGCNSDAAQYIVNARCLGLANCSMLVRYNKTYEWPITEIRVAGEVSDFIPSID